MASSCTCSWTGVLLLRCFRLPPLTLCFSRLVPVASQDRLAGGWRRALALDSAAGTAWSPASGLTGPFTCNMKYWCAELACAWRSAEREIQELLEFRCVRRLRTVHGLLQEANGLGLLADPLMERATAEILAGARPRHEIQRDIKQKERAREMLVRKYKSSALPEVCPSARALIPCATAPCTPSCWRLSFMLSLRTQKCTLHRSENK